MAADLIDFNVNQNAWISSMLLYKLGLFGMDWDHTPFFDNKASFQRGINQAIRRTAVELVDTLGRVRGTTQIDQNLQDARGALAVRRRHLVFRPAAPSARRRRRPASIARRSAICAPSTTGCGLQGGVRRARRQPYAVHRPHRQRHRLHLGHPQERAENYNAGWFDTRADDRFWFAYGQLYGYYGIMTAARADFEDVHQGST